MNNEIRDFDYNFVEIPCADLKIIFISDDKTEVTGHTDIHMHSFWELFFVKEGSLAIHTETNDYELSDNQALIIPPNVYHNSRSLPHAVKRSIFFTFEKRGSSKEEKLFSDVYDTFDASGFHKIEDGSYIGILLGMILENLSTDKVGREWRIRANVTELIFHLFDSIKNRGLHQKSGGLKQNTYWVYKYEIDRLLDSYYTNDVSLDLLSEKLFISPQSITRIISAVYGKSFNELKLELKMRNAKKLLRETEKTIAEIAKEIGYSSLRGFLSAFQKYEGSTPSEYRQKKLNEKRKEAEAR